LTLRERDAAVRAQIAQRERFALRRPTEDDGFAQDRFVDKAALLQGM
jgi:hypothetical protein